VKKDISLENNTIENVKWHTRQKHAFLEEYLKIWYEQVGKKPQVSLPTLDIFDLFASYGYCYCQEKKEGWKGSALLAADCLKNYDKGKILFLNTYNPDEKKLQIQREALEENIANMNLPRRVEVLIESKPLEGVIDVATSHLNPDYPSLWILDPYKPEALPWNVVEKICILKGQHKNGKIRRPELFINLMTGILQRYTGITNLKEDYVGLALGMSTSEWQCKLKHHTDSGKNTREALILMYAEKLMEHYEKEPIILDVKAVEGNVVYTVFLCTDNDAGHYVMKLHRIPEYQEWVKFEWESTAKRISNQKKQTRKAAKNGQKQAFLDIYD